MIIFTVAVLVKQIACKLANPTRDEKNVNIKIDIVSGLEASWANGPSTDSHYSSVVDQGPLGNRYQRNMPHHGRAQSRHFFCLDSCDRSIYFKGENTACLSYSPVVAGILDTWHNWSGNNHCIVLFKSNFFIKEKKIQAITIRRKMNR